MEGSESTKSSPLLNDQPSPIDLLGFESYATALEDVIQNPQASTPFIVGIFGRWGIGKTTLMRLLESRLQKRGATTVWFSAWAYGQEKEIAAAFLQCLVSQLSARLGIAKQIRFSFGLLRRGLAWDRIALHLPTLFLRTLLVAAPATVGLAAAWTFGSAGLLGAALGSVGLAGSLLVGWQQVRPVIVRLGGTGPAETSLYRAMDFEAHVGVIERIREQFARLVAALPNPDTRVIIFIDDLDRCDPENALRLLDAIKVFFDAPRCVFILGLDLSVVQKALDKKYHEDAIAQREYLGKIVQLPFHLPPPTPTDLGLYLGRLDVRFPDDRCGEVFVRSAAQNPREIKRIINTFGLNWYLAQARVGESITPVRLAKIIVIQQGFDQLFGLLRERPEWLAVLEQAFRRTVSAADETVPDLPTSETLVTVPDLSPATLIMGPRGIAVPPAIMPFLENHRLQDLLTIHPLAPKGEDNANFAMLSADEIAIYFTFASRGSTPAPGTGEPGTAGDRSGLGPPEALPDFGPRYKVVRRLGSGGIGEVFLAKDSVTGREVAIKRLHITLAADSAWNLRFRREIELLQRVTDHSNIVQILASGTAVDSENALFYVMENAVGIGLDWLLEKGPLTSTQQRAILLPVFDALDHVHNAGIVHRDVKPSSIIVTASGVPKLIDFGLAFLSEEGRDSLSQTGFVLATPNYASPEQILNEKIDARSDLFSFGAVIYECLTGSKAFSASRQIVKGEFDRPSTKNPDVPSAMDRFISRMLAVDPARRFSTAKAARVSFARALGEEGPSAHT